MKQNDAVSDAELHSIKERCNKATPGPWISYVEGRDHFSGSNFIMTGGGDLEIHGGTIEDQEFVAHARQDIPRLIKEIERLKKVIDDKKEIQK